MHININYFYIFSLSDLILDLVGSQMSTTLNYSYDISNSLSIIIYPYNCSLLLTSINFSFIIVILSFILYSRSIEVLESLNLNLILL
jgi:hypothetical protein